MGNPSLFMILIGAEIRKRHTEQHDVYFGIGNEWTDLIPGIRAFWPEADRLHVDAWRRVETSEGHRIMILPRDAPTLDNETSLRLFFLNLGGYKKDEFNEFHYKMIVAAASKADAVLAAKKTAFFKHTSLPGGAGSHIDDKYGIDVDDAYAVEDILAPGTESLFRIAIIASNGDEQPDKINLGYFKFPKS